MQSSRPTPTWLNNVLRVSLLYSSKCIIIIMFCYTMISEWDALSKLSLAAEFLLLAALRI